MVEVNSPRPGKRSYKVMIPENLMVKNRVNIISHTKYVLDADIKGCFDNINRIIPVTIFTMMLYNACFTYQEDKTYNLLISALDGFNMICLIDDDLFFMNTFSELPR